jgi:hypothetical protein
MKSNNYVCTYKLSENRQESPHKTNGRIRLSSSTGYYGHQFVSILPYGDAAVDSTNMETILRSGQVLKALKSAINTSSGEVDVECIIDVFHVVPNDYDGEKKAALTAKPDAAILSTGGATSGFVQLILPNHHPLIIKAQDAIVAIQNCEGL